MAERQIHQEIDDNNDPINPSVTEVDFGRDEIMKRYEISSINTLKRWCQVLDIPYGATFSPQSVARLDHLAYHIRTLKMSMADYKKMIGKQPAEPEVNETHGRYTTSSEEAEQGNAIAGIVKQRYQGTIDKMAKPLAMAFWESLDSAVLREVATIAESNTIPSRLETNILPSFENDSPMWLLPPGEV